MDLTTAAIVAQVYVQLSHEKGVVTMVTTRNPSWYHITWCKFSSTSEVWTSAIMEWVKLRS
jgi:hypothetical protein